MKKTYLYRARTALLVFAGGGETRRLEFSGGIFADDGQRDRPASFTTSDVKVQSMIEKDPRFGKTIFLKAEKKKAVAVSGKSAADKLKPIDSVQSVNDAVEYMCTQHNCVKSKLTSIKKINEAAARSGICFPNLK